MLNTNNFVLILNLFLNLYTRTRLLSTFDSNSCTYINRPFSQLFSYIYNCLVRTDIHLINCYRSYIEKVGYIKLSQTINQFLIMCSDDLDPLFLEELTPKLLSYYSHLFNTVLTKYNFPEYFKLAKILTIPKMNNEFKPSYP